MTDTKPIQINNHRGTIAVHSVAIELPTRFVINHLFTYKENGIPKTYPIEVGRVYTLSDLLSILGKLTSDFLVLLLTLSYFEQCPRILFQM